VPSLLALNAEVIGRVHRPTAANAREEYALSSKEGPAGGQKKEQGYLEKVLDKVQKKRRGEKSSGSAVDKAIEKAQELGLTDKLAQIQRELGEKRRSEDVPDQIRKLAELREAGAITDEEFEKKKKDLLERM
jgi:ATP-dependent Lon protease